MQNHSSSRDRDSLSRSRNRRPDGFGRHRLLALVYRLLLVVAVEAVLVDVVDDLVGNVVADALTPLAEEADLGGGDIVLNELRDYADVLLPLRELNERVVWGVLINIAEHV